MWWLLIIVVLIYSGIYTAAFNCIYDTAETEKEKKRAKFMYKVCMWIAIAILGGIILYGLGWIWYYFCGGFLVFEDLSLDTKIICGIATLIPLGFILGWIMIFLGYDL